MSIQCPYKDALPDDTINKFRKCLINNNIFVHEAQWFYGPADIFSCRLGTDDFKSFSVGKGIGKKYTLASAYGELMERMQSYVFFAPLNIPRLDQDMLGFTFDPTEIRAESADKLPKLPESFKRATPFVSGENLYDVWEYTKEYLINNTNINRFSCIPYYGLNEDRVVNLPFNYLNHFYISNGMSAGNTHEESITQGVGEILERYAKVEIFFKGKETSLIPNEIIKEISPEYYRLILEVEAKGNFKILLRDCSLGLGLPIICAVFIDRDSNQYSVKFASDPDITIAIQRCLTEYFQGIQQGDESKLNRIILNRSEQSEELINFYKATLIGNGQFPRELLLSNSIIKELHVNYFNSNKQKMEYSIELIQKCGFPDIYIRDNSFMGIPAHQVIVPGMSELKIYQNSKAIKSHILYNHYELLKLLSQQDKIEENEYVVNFLEHECAWKPKDKAIPLYKFLFTDKIKHQNWLSLTLELLLSFIYFKKGLLKKAEYYLDYHIKSVEKNKKKPKLQFHYCSKHYLTLKAEKVDDVRIEESLSTIYGAELVKTIINFYNTLNIKELVNELELPYYNEEHCKLYIKLKEAHKKNPISQDGLSELFKPIWTKTSVC